jgi:AcrR family transcriptional regulator
MTSAAPRTQALDSRDEILKAAMQLFANRGFHETSMSEVAREARVSKALIFWHFKTKEELFMAVLSRLLEPYFIDFAEESEKLSEREQIQRLVESYVLFVRDNANSVSFFLRRLMAEEVPSAFTEQIRQLYQGYQSLLTDRIRAAQEKGQVLRSYRPEVVANFLVSALNGFLVNLLFSTSANFDLDEALKMLCELLLDHPAGERPAQGSAATA